MGLDMYMYSREKGESTNLEGVEVGYWRKANHIHKWFVDNVQGGVDDCGEYLVPREKLEMLHETIVGLLNVTELVDGEIMEYQTINDKGELVTHKKKGKVIKDATFANKLLPTTSGFFFGGTDYDEYYYQDLLDTKEILEKALEDNECDYYYQSSW